MFDINWTMFGLSIVQLCAEHWQAQTCWRSFRYKDNVIHYAPTQADIILASPGYFGKLCPDESWWFLFFNLSSAQNVCADVTPSLWLHLPGFLIAAIVIMVKDGLWFTNHEHKKRGKKPWELSTQINVHWGMHTTQKNNNPIDQIQPSGSWNVTPYRMHVNILNNVGMQMQLTSNLEQRTIIKLNQSEPCLIHTPPSPPSCYLHRVSHTISLIEVTAGEEETLAVINLLSSWLPQNKSEVMPLKAKGRNKSKRRWGT